ncbi:MAG: uracil-DNA glycosylase [Desulfobacterales bacterium]|nr:uracil-DNA glycosylase [Desulfobacterales bacterium]
MEKTSFVDCHRCKHYYVSWDPQCPHGCKSMNFKSRELPSIAVYKNSGAPCLLFLQKEIKKKEHRKLDRYI